VTTRQELIDGLNMVIRQGLRQMSSFGPGDWDRPVVHHDWQRQLMTQEYGWNRKQVYCHLTAIALITFRMMNGERMSGADISRSNDELVYELQELSAEDLMARFRDAHQKVLDMVAHAPEQALSAPIKVGAIEGGASEVMDSALVLHALSHLYGAGGAVSG
jgi:hypothetical protein